MVTPLQDYKFLNKGWIKNFDHRSGIDVKEKIVFCVESHVFMGREFYGKWILLKFAWLKPISFAEYLKQFLEVYGRCDPLYKNTTAFSRLGGFRSLWNHLETRFQRVWNPLETLWKLF